MAQEAKFISQVIDSVLLPIGFKRRKKAWFLTNDETVRLVVLQKCDWGNWYFINTGVLLRALSDNLHPAANECHIFTRLDPSLGCDPAVEQAMDFERSAMADHLREITLRNGLNNELIAFLNHFESLERTRESLMKRRYAGLAVLKRVCSELRLGFEFY